MQRTPTNREGKTETLSLPAWANPPVFPSEIPKGETMETVCMLIDAIGSLMSGCVAALTLLRYGSNPTPTTPAPPTLSVPGVSSPGVVINTENIIINGPVFITNNPNADETQPIRDAAPDDEDHAPKTSR